MKEKKKKKRDNEERYVENKCIACSRGKSLEKALYLFPPVALSASKLARAHMREVAMYVYI